MFTSYAQNFEDVMLWRALKHVQSGFYIDIGAQDPLVDSVSRGFYEQGWRGVSIEPTAFYADRLRLNRPDEDVRQCAVGVELGKLTFFEFRGTGLSTADLTAVEAHRANGYLPTMSTIDVVPLSKILDDYAGREVHWLKIDVEGMERSVLESWGNSPLRPWLVVIESTVPGTAEKIEDGCELLLRNKGYELAYFDGLNSYFVSAAKRELLQSFKIPPNVFDDFTLAGLSTSSMTRKLSTEVAGLLDAIETLSEELDILKNDYHVAIENEQQLRSANSALAEEITSLKSDCHAAVATEAQLRELNNTLSAEMSALRFDYRVATEHAASLDGQLSEALAYGQAIRTSFSWRITAPYRFISKSIRQGIKNARPVVRLARSIGGSAIRWSILGLIKIIQRSHRMKSLVTHRYGHVDQLRALAAWARGNNSTALPLMQVEPTRTAPQTTEVRVQRSLSDEEKHKLSEQSRLHYLRLSPPK